MLVFKEQITFQIQRYCPHCNNNSVQNYLMHYVYDENQGSRWDGEIETNENPASYLVLSCQTCEQLLLYHIYLTNDELEDFITFSKSGDRVRMDWDEEEVEREIELIFPSLYEDIHSYVPKSVRKSYLKALKSYRSPEAFVLEIGKALEVICQERGATGGNLHQKIERLSKIAELPDPIKSIALKLKDARNFAAHENGKIKPDLVPIVRNLFRVLLNHIYVLPLQQHEFDNLIPEKRSNQ